MARNLGAVFPTKSAAEWAALNPLVMRGQGVYEEDTGALKIGNGTDVYNDLPYFVGAIVGGDAMVASTSEPFRVYGTDGAGGPAVYALNFDPAPITVPARDDAGRLSAAAPTEDNHLVNLAFLDGRAEGLLEESRKALLAGDKVVPLVPGAWYPIPGTGTTTTRATANNGESRFGRIVAGRDCTLDAMALEVTTAGTAGSLIRFGIYDFDPMTGVVGPLLLDAGTIEAESVGTKILNTSFPVQAGDHYLVGAAIQGNPATRPVLRAMVSNDVFLASGNAAQISSTGISNLTSTMTGPLPTTPGFGFGGSGALFRVMVRAGT